MEADAYRHVSRAARVDCALRAEIQAGRRRQYDEHHCREYADRRESRAVALHAVDHRRDRHEVPLVVIIFLVLLQHPADEHRAGDEYHVGRDDDHYHREEEYHQRRHRVLDADREPVRAAEQDNSADADYRIRAWRLLAEALAAEQRHRGRKIQLDERAYEQQREYHQKHYRGVAQRVSRYCKFVVNVGICDVVQSELRDLRQTDSGGKADCKRYHRRGQSLPDQNPRDSVLVHAEYIVQSELAASPPYQKRVGIKQEYDRKYDHDEAAEQHCRHNRRAAVGIHHRR